MTDVCMADVQGVKVRFVAAGPAAAHCLVGAMDGKLFTWGRNEVMPLLHTQRLIWSYDQINDIPCS